MQQTWLDLGHALTAAEHLWDLATQDECPAFGPFNIVGGASLGIFSIPNVGRYICEVVKIVGRAIIYALLFAATIAYHVVDEDYDIATLGEHDDCGASIFIFFLYKKCCEQNVLLIISHRAKYGNLCPILCKGNIPQRNGALTVDGRGIKCHTLEHERSTHRNEETTSRTSQGHCESYRPGCKWLEDDRTFYCQQTQFNFFA